MIVDSLYKAYSYFVYGSQWVDYNHGLPDLNKMCYIQIEDMENYGTSSQIYHPIPEAPTKGYLSSEGWKLVDGSPLGFGLIVSNWMYTENNHSRCDIL